MRCLLLQSSLLPHFHAKHHHYHNHTITSQCHTTKLFWPRGHHFSSATTKALSHLMVVPPAQSGDLSTLLPISAVLLLAYFIANFVVPAFLINSFGYDKSNQEGKVEDINTTEDDE